MKQRGEIESERAELTKRALHNMKHSLYLLLVLMPIVKSFVLPLFRTVNRVAHDAHLQRMTFHDSTGYDSKLMTGFMNRIKENNDMRGKSLADFTPIVIDDKVCGYVADGFADNLLKYGKDIFRIDNDVTGCFMKLDPTLNNLQSRSDAVAMVLSEMRAVGLIPGWRDELVAVSTSFYAPPALLVERAAYEWFGARGYGVHVNGYVRAPGSTSSRPDKLWLGRRAADKSTWPNMLDHISAGGQPHGIGVMENVIKECGEEAGIPHDLASTAVPVGYVSYCQVDDRGRLKRDTLFCFDIDLPPNFQPVAIDGEVQGFECRAIDSDVMKIVADGGSAGYKPNCNLVVLDFLVRHGFIKPEADGYLQLVHALRQSVDFESNRL